MDRVAEWLRTLDLQPGASREEIRQSWRDLAQVWHPDRFNGNPRLRNKAERMLQRINEAYQNLTRADPDALRRASRSGGYEPRMHDPRAEPDAWEVLEQGVAAWNLWRKKYSNITPEFPGACFEGRCWEGIDLREARLAGANLEGADLYKANLSYADLTRARAARADLGRALLLEAALVQADLRGADLSSADLRGADLRRVRLDQANLVGTRLEGADLSEAVGLDPEQIRVAFVDLDTRLPTKLG